MHARIENGSVVEYPIINLRQRLPNVSLPTDLTIDAGLPSGFVFVHNAAPQAYNPTTHKPVLRPLPTLVDGRWQTAFDIIPLSQDELDNLAAAAREQAKAQREQNVASIKVTTQAGNTFDGDETSQTRMARAIIALQATGTPTVTWVLADNRVIQATVGELVEALALAGAAQATVWVMN